MDFAKRELQVTSETPSDKIFPAENALVKDQPEKGGNLWPVLMSQILVQQGSEGSLGVLMSW